MQHKVHDLVKLVHQGKFLDALEALYAEGVEMNENLQPATVGKDANRTREQEWVNTIKTLHEYRAQQVIADGNRSAINWVVDYVDVDNNRIQMNQWAIQLWEHGQIVREQFVYDPASVSVEKAA